ncbi:MAG: glycosyltransferase family 4 protein [Patescibacteria group bacterium]|jgi:glycosyltransferase involved in cell wall biosynthesis
MNEPKKTEKNNKIKIVQVISDSAIGGGPKHVLGLLNHIDKDKFEVLLIAPRGWLASRASGITGVGVKMIEFKSKYDIRAFIKLRKDIAEFRAHGDPFGPIIIHAHGPRAASFCRYALQAKERFVYTEHIWNSDYHLKSPLNSWLQKNGLRAISKRADIIFAVSNSVKKFLVEVFKLNGKDVVVIPNAIEIETEPKKASRAEDKLLIGTIGSLNKQKGHIYLIQAIERVVKSLPKTRLEIVGDGPEKEKIQREIKKLGLESRVQLLGKIDKPKRLLKNWDIFVLPSLSETFGLVVLEAFESKVPVIATKVGGLPELITNNDNGILVPPADPDKLSKAILYLLVEKKVRNGLAEEAYKLLKEKYDWSKIIKEIEREYYKLIR